MKIKRCFRKNGVLQPRIRPNETTVNAQSPGAKQSTHSEQAFRSWLICASIETHVQREATCFSAAGEPHFCGDTLEVLPGDQPNLPLHPPANLSLAGTAIVAQRDQPNLPPHLPANPCKGSPRKEPFGIAMESLLCKLCRCFCNPGAKRPPAVWNKKHLVSC